MCLGMLFFCGVSSLYFSRHYFRFSYDGSLLSFMLFLFLSVMGLLVVSYSVLGTLIMWEYLGVVSFFLILFYGNLDSLRATLITVFASRFGDVCLFGFILFVTNWFGSISSLFFLLIVLFVVLTKSACFPFIAWLLEAMRAPTPVSSLVHSSTLVAAGVWFLFRYGSSVINFCPKVDGVFFVMCLVSIVVSAFCSIVFLDVKKIIALSTCNNIAWCIVFFLFGDVVLGLFQLLCHGVSKCILFISLGDLMGCSDSAQDSRGVYCSSYNGFSLVSVQTVLVLSLSGLPFVGVFFTKHFLVSSICWGYSVFCLFLVFFGFFLSCAYSFRLLGLLSGFRSLGVWSFGPVFLFVLFFPLLNSILGVLSCFSEIELFFIDSFCSVVLLLVQLLGCLAGLFFYFFSVTRSFSFSCLFLWGCDFFVSLFYCVFLAVFRLFVFPLYRWEVSLLGFFYNIFVRSGLIFGFGWLSLKFLFLCLFGSIILVLFFM